MTETNQKIDKRMNYFDRQFLRAQDFEDEQNYLLERRWRHNRFLHTAGVVENLSVTKSNDNPKKVLIEEGMAIDSAGKEIILFEAKLVDMPSDSTTTLEVY